ncbi:MAG: hypothetical protein V8S39_11500 [Lachnospiraceae bacterium]
MIRPVEFQGVVQRNQDMASVNQNENDKPFINHENVVAQIEKQTETKIRDVNEKDNADNQGQKKDAKDKGSNEYFGDGGKKKKHFSNTAGTVKIKERRKFDVKI